MRLLILIFVLVQLIGCSGQQTNDDLFNFFKNPPQSYYPTVYWFWNGKIEKEQIKSQLQEMKRSQTVGSVCILGWEGLEIEYLSEEWFDKIKFACSIAKEEGLEIWLYDELRWPSGHAGGQVLESNPEYQAKCLSRSVKNVSGPKELILTIIDIPIAIIAGRMENGILIEESLTDLSGKFNGGKFRWKVPAGDWQIHIYKPESCSFTTTFTDLKYVDLLDTAAVRKFVNITYDEYYKHMPEYFGDVIKVIITDEPGVYCGITDFLLNPGTIPWTPLFLSEFQLQKGYDLKKYLPALWDDIGIRTVQIRIDFYEVYAKLFQDSYFKTLHDWCNQHNIKINIQPSHEETLKYATRLMGDYFKAMEYSHLHGADEVYSWDKHLIVPKIASSAARTFGSQNVYCESFGAYGWDLAPKKMKAVTDWLYSRGINRLILNSFYFNMEGDWLFEIPPSLFYQNPLWNYLPLYTDYVARLSYMLSEGRNITPVAMLYPIQSAQGLLSAINENKVDQIDFTLKQISNILLQSQYDFDYLDERTMQNTIVVQEKENMSVLSMVHDNYWIDYQILILPNVSVLGKKVLKKIKLFYQKGGKVIAFGALPKIAPDGEDISAEVGKIWKPAKANYLLNSNENGGIAAYFPDEKDAFLSLIEQILDPDIKLGSQQKSINYIHKIKNDRDIYFISNNDSIVVDTEISFSVQGVPQIWNPEKGKIHPVNVFRIEGDRTILPVRLESFGSLLVVFDKKLSESAYVMDTNMEIENIKFQRDSLFVTAFYKNSNESYINAYWKGNTYYKQFETSAPETVLLKDTWKFYPEDRSFPEEIRQPGSWTEAQVIKQLNGANMAPAHPYFSGKGIYSQKFELEKEFFENKKKFVLDTGDINEVMEVCINSYMAGVRVWHPFELDITEYLNAGENEISIMITNTPANAYVKKHKTYPNGENWGKILKSGLLESVKIYVFDVQEFALSKQNL